MAHRARVQPRAYRHTLHPHYNYLLMRTYMSCATKPGAYRTVTSGAGRGGAGRVRHKT